MSASQAGDDCAQCPADVIEEIAPDRNKPKLRYQGYMFRNVSVNGWRFRWRCTVAKCGSRLETDKYGDRHLKYSFEPHDEEAHLDATLGKRRRSQMYQRKVIDGFTYVLENIIAEQAHACWQCEIVGCHGRCRTTYDFVPVAGPSPHSCRRAQASANLYLSASASQTGTTSFAGECGRQRAGQKACADTVEATRGPSGEAILPKPEVDCDAMYYPQVILNERSSPPTLVVANGVHGGVFGNCDCGRTPPTPTETQLRARHGPKRKLVFSGGEKGPEAGPSHRNAGNSAVTGEPQLQEEARKDDSTAEEPEVIDLVESSGDDICEEEAASANAGCDGHGDDFDGQDSSYEKQRLERELLEADLRIEFLKRKLSESKLRSPTPKKCRPQT